MQTRSYRIEPRTAHDGMRRGLSVRSYRTYVLNLEGAGHWCVGGPEAATLPTEAAAKEMGETWVELGLQPCEQTPERITRMRHENELLLNAGVDPASLESLAA